MLWLTPSIPVTIGWKPRPITLAMTSPASPETIGTNRRPPKKARYSGSFMAEKRL